MIVNQFDFIQRIDAIYARQSIDKADSISVESQIEFCKYETRGGKYQVYADKGYSGKNTDRPEFQRMLIAIRDGKIQRVICYKLDRCSRSILDFAELIEEFQKYDVEFVSCTEKFDTSTPMGRAMLNICIVFAQLERETIQQRVHDAYHSRCKKGFYMGGKVPFGFRLEPYTVDGKQTSCYTEEEVEGKILRFLYKSYAVPNATLGDVIRSAQELGVSNPKRLDGHWVRSHLGRMLQNPIYVKADIRVYRYFKEKGVMICNDPQDFIGKNGCYLYKDKDDSKCLVLAPHRGLIDSDLWLKCQKKQIRTTKNFSSESQSSWLCGKLKCSGCGYSLIISKTKRKNDKCYRYIVCPRSHGADAICNGIHGWRADTAEDFVAALLKQRLKKLFPKLENSKAETDPKRIALSAKIAQIECEIEKVTAKALESGNALLPYLNEQVRLLENKKAALISCISECTKHEDLDMIEPNYDQLWFYLSIKDKSMVADALINTIELSIDSCKIMWNL